MSCLLVVMLASWVMVVVSLLQDNKESAQWRICWGVDTIGALHSINNDAAADAQQELG
jgi:hypothetical protein